MWGLGESAGGAQAQTRSCGTGQLSARVGTFGQLSQGSYLREVWGCVLGTSGELPQHQDDEVGFWGQVIPEKAPF